MFDYDLATFTGIITVQNTNRGTHRTFRIKKRKDTATFKPGERIISLLTGPDNTNSYTQIGTVTNNGHIFLWRRFDTEGYRRLTDVLVRKKHWQAHGLQYHAEGRCSRCGRLLTTPDSAQRGIGPECAKK